MMSQQAALPPQRTLTPQPVGRQGFLQRKCACGRHTTDQHGECTECRKKRLALQRRAVNQSGPDIAPPIVHEVLRSAGRPLDPATRAFFEPRFGHDFTQVRVHSDARAGESAQAVNALAYTVGRDIVFGTGQYAPQTSAGRKLLAHELTHTLQQSFTTEHELTLDNDPRREQVADNVAVAVESPQPAQVARDAIGLGGTPTLQRKLVVNNPTGTPAGAPAGDTNENIIKGYIATLCAGFDVTGGQVVPKRAVFCPTGAATSSTPESCNCLCSMHMLKDSTGSDITWTIMIDDNDWPHTDPATKTVTVHSPYSGVQFGAWAKGPPAHRVVEQNWLVLGHELCGHGELFARGAHPTGPSPRHGGRPSHDVTVRIENRIASEHGIPSTDLRGLFADPHHGESFARVTIAQFPIGSASVSALLPSERHQIDVAEAFIKSAPVKMDVVGHADRQASTNNLGISRNRANAIKTELIGRGIASTRFLATNGVGEAECAIPGNQPTCRKVDIFMFIMEGASVTHP